MKYIVRALQPNLEGTLKRQKSILLLGPRQTGKSTLLNHLHKDLIISFAPPETRQAYEKNVGLLRTVVEKIRKEFKGRGKPTVVIDEVQKVPLMMDAVQDLIDRSVANFILTGSSARKLRRGPHVNLLPGGVILYRLDPLALTEISNVDLSALLLFGSLPGVYLEPSHRDRDKLLESYVTAYLEEEIRAEAVVRNVGFFSRFLELAASESGQVLNFSKLSQDVGVSHKTIASYYEILDDCLIAERVDPLTMSKTRKKLTKTSKYLFFDLGVRRRAAREGVELPRDKMGQLFEQFVGLELIRQARLRDQNIKIRFWRDPEGPEVDWVVDYEKKLIPIEVKFDNSPSAKDTRYLQIFLEEYPQAKQGYLISQFPHRVQLTPKITGIPWREISSVFDNLH
jgi:predicted AAA+ superfamily ATPase